MEEIKKDIKCKNQTIILQNPPLVLASYTVCGPKEGNGTFGKWFDKVLEDDLFGEKTYEKAELKMMECAIDNAIKRSNIPENEFDLLVCGDLLNQTISSSFSARKFHIPYAGVYGACSTMCESLALASCLISGETHEKIVCATGSHFSSAERQYRFPLELGNQRPPTSQWTATGSAATVLVNGKGKSGVKITSVTFGTVEDFGIKDVNNMGGAMAPAAFSTLSAHLHNTKTDPDEYDAILTGDLGKLGSEILIDLCEHAGIKIGSNYSDCGQMIYSSTQHSYMGGSGCGCSAIIVNSIILDKLRKGEFKKVLYIATGALLSLTTSQQGETIPGIAHAVCLEHVKEK